MRPDILIVGQGLAGTMLGWELERAGISFVIADSGHASAATSAAAGIINPITGRRLVKSWRIETLLPEARAVYHDFEAELGVTLWRDMRVRRLFGDDRERAVFVAKHAQRELNRLPMGRMRRAFGFAVRRESIFRSCWRYRGHGGKRRGGSALRRSIRPMKVQITR